MRPPTDPDQLPLNLHRSVLALGAHRLARGFRRRGARYASAMSSAVSARNDLRDVIGEGVHGLGVILRDGLRVLWACWPQLLVVFLIGATVRNLALWLAVKATLIHAFVGQAIMPIAPLATLVALVVMLRIAARQLANAVPRSASDQPADDLPANNSLKDASPADLLAWADAESGTKHRLGMRRWGGDLIVATTVLVPFLAVYASYGLLEEDRVGYIHDVTTDATANGVFDVNWARLDVLHGWPLIVTVALAITLRKLLTSFKVSERSWRWASLVAYIEAVWVVILARYFQAQLSDIQAWVSSRAVVVGLLRWKDAAIDLLGPVAPLVHHTLGWISQHLASMGELVVIPVAWMAIGATITGSQLADSDSALAMPTSQRERYERRLARIPSPMRRAVARVADPVLSPVQEAVESLRRVAVAGLVPMVLFCLVFVLASRVQVLVAWIARWFIGPQSWQDQLATQSYLMVAERAAYTLVVVALLTAAISTVVAGQRRRTPAELGEASIVIEPVVSEPVVGETGSDPTTPQRAASGNRA